MKMIEVSENRLEYLLQTLSYVEGYCAVCPNTKGDCPRNYGVMSQKSCEEVLKDYLKGK